MKSKIRLKHFDSFVVMRYEGVEANTANQFRREVA